MKFICLGYYDEERWLQLSEDERNALIDACFAYDDELRAKGYFVAGEGLQGADMAVTLRRRGGKVSATDGPYAETKEQIGGFLMLEARDMNQAIELMSRHPGVQIGPFEVRGTEDMTPLKLESEARRGIRRP